VLANALSLAVCPSPPCCCAAAAASGQALSSVLYATSRVPDLPELTTLHKMFAAKYGKVRHGRCVVVMYLA
jgi:hypothetical protein